MRKLNIGTNKHTEVFAVDEKGPGNANHIYEIYETNKSIALRNRSGRIEFQKGPIKESGINGIHNEDLIAIVIDRLNGFQEGPYACKENGKVLVNLHGALIWLRTRTKKREARGVEGSSKI